MKTLGSLILRLIGWRYKLHHDPWPAKCVIIIAPHTSSWDYIIGILLKFVMDIQINYVAKKELFRPPFAWFFKMTGGAPIKRNQHQHQVETIVKIFNHRQVFRLASAPEGTRAKAEWKTGFYHIALGAEVPLRMVRLDYEKKIVTLSSNFILSGDQERDFKTIHDFFNKGKAKYPEQFLNLLTTKSNIELT